MYQKLLKLGLGVAATAAAYWATNQGTKLLTGKHIHEHALDCFPEFKKRIEAWCGSVTEEVKVFLRLLKDDGSVHGKRVLRAIGLWKAPQRLPIMITEEMISPEQASQLGFDLNMIVDQELAYLTA